MIALTFWGSQTDLWQLTLTHFLSDNLTTFTGSSNEYSIGRNTKTQALTSKYNEHISASIKVHKRIFKQLKYIKAVKKARQLLFSYMAL